MISLTIDVIYSVKYQTVFNIGNAIYDEIKVKIRCFVYILSLTFDAIYSVNYKVNK